MTKNDYTTHLWIIGWGVVAIVCATTWTVWGAITATVAVIFIIVGIFFGNRWGRGVYRKIMLRKPFEVYYRLDESIQQSFCTIVASHEVRYLQFTIRMRNELNVQSVRLTFRGRGTVPQIGKLYDWNRGIGIIPRHVDAHPTEDDSWFWEYYSPYPRFVGSRITVGLECLATNSFDGVLEFGVTFSEVEKVTKMPFIVKGDK